jgi:hypothetical protein
MFDWTLKSLANQIGELNFNIEFSGRTIRIDHDIKDGVIAIIEVSMHINDYVIPIGESALNLTERNVSDANGDAASVQMLRESFKSTLKFDFADIICEKILKKELHDLIDEMDRARLH